MPRKKRAALASAENGMKSIEERPEKKMRIDTGRTLIASAEEKEVCYNVKLKTQIESKAHTGNNKEHYIHLTLLPV